MGGGRHGLLLVELTARREVIPPGNYDGALLLWDFVAGEGWEVFCVLAKGLPALAAGLEGFGFEKWVGAGAGEGADEGEFGEFYGGEFGPVGFGLKKGGGVVFEFEGESAHWLIRILRNSAGVASRTPNFSSGRKSVLLNVTRQWAQALEAGDFIRAEKEVAKKGIDGVLRNFFAMEEFLVFQKAGMGDGPFPCGRE